MTMSTTVIASRRDEKTLPDGTFLVADSKLYALGEQRPYFSVTGELWQSEGWYRNGQEGRLISCGAMGDEIARRIPKLSPVVALHLADEDGRPMHAIENGWYWYRDSHEQAARHLRIDPSELPKGLDREQFAEFVETLQPRWKAEADKARAILEAAS